MKSAKARDGLSKWLIIGTIAVLLAAIGVLLFLLLRDKGGAPEVGADNISTPANRDPNAAVGQIEGKTQEEIIAELNKIVEQGMFNISINSAITFETGDGEGDVRIENIEANAMLMSVEIALDDTGEVIYTTGLIEPGYHIQTDHLDTPLEKGVYPATAMFTAYDPVTEAVIGRAGAKVTITVNN